MFPPQQAAFARPGDAFMSSSGGGGSDGTLQ